MLLNRDGAYTLKLLGREYTECFNGIPISNIRRYDSEQAAAAWAFPRKPQAGIKLQRDHYCVTCRYTGYTAENAYDFPLPVNAPPAPITVIGSSICAARPVEDQVKAYRIALMCFDEKIIWISLIHI